MNIGRIRFFPLKNTRECFRSISKRDLGSSACMQKKEKEKWTGIKEEWDRPKNEWNSFFHYFAPEKGIAVDILHSLQKPLNFSPKGFKEWYKKHKYTKALFDQTFNEDRVTVLGCELAAAHFIVFRGGKVRQKGSEEWIVIDEDDNYNLPRHYTPAYFVECIDASGTNLLYEGLECMDHLQYLKWLNLSNCVNIDDWGIDRICGQYSSTLEYLNLTNCTSVTERGIAALARLRELKTLDITGLNNIKDIELLCLLIEDILPNINIIGVDYMKFPELEGKLD